MNETIVGEQHRMRSYLQRIATGPELSKDLSEAEAQDGMGLILDGRADPVQAGIFLIALRMKRETMAENHGVLKALIDRTARVTADVRHVVEISDPFDGYTRGLPVSPFLPAVLAACGWPAVSTGAHAMGPKFGMTHRAVLSAAGAEVDLDVHTARQRIDDPNTGWAYVDQRYSCTALHGLSELRTAIVKRPCLTTLEVLLGPIQGSQSTTLVTGYVHKPYPPIYSALARASGYTSALIIRGVEGGVVPSLSQPSRMLRYLNGGEDEQCRLDPSELGLHHADRAVPLPDGLDSKEVSSDGIASTIDTEAAAAACASQGLDAIQGKKGMFYDALVYSGSIILSSLEDTLDEQSAADRIRSVLDSGQAASRLLP